MNGAYQEEINITPPPKIFFEMDGEKPSDQRAVMVGETRIVAVAS